MVTGLLLSKNCMAGAVPGLHRELVSMHKPKLHNGLQSIKTAQSIGISVALSGCELFLAA
jgi:hypothetical protein